MKSGGVDVEFMDVEGADHFTVCELLANSEYRLTQVTQQVIFWPHQFYFKVIRFPSPILGNLILPPSPL